MSHSSAGNPRLFVTSYKEIAFIFFTFIFVLVLIYPKGEIQERVLQEQSNYDLTIAYLQNMLHFDPENDELMFALTSASIETDKFELAEKLLTMLLEYPQKNIQNRAILMKYHYLSKRYFSLNDPDEIKRVKMEINTLFKRIVTRELDGGIALTQWYEYALSFDNTEASHKLACLLADSVDSTLRPTWDAHCFYLSIQRDAFEEAEHSLTRLLNEDVQKRNEWRKEAYYLALHQKDYVKIESILKRFAKEEPLWLQELANFYIMQQNYGKATALYLQVFQNEPSKEKRRELLMKTLDTLQAGESTQAAAELAHHFEAQYIHDNAMMRYFLKLYLAAARPAYARELSIKLLKQAEE